jgi:hypothetical protein
MAQLQQRGTQTSQHLQEVLEASPACMAAGCAVERCCGTRREAQQNRRPWRLHSAESLLNECCSSSRALSIFISTPSLTLSLHNSHINTLSLSLHNSHINTITLSRSRFLVNTRSNASSRASHYCMFSRALCKPSTVLCSCSQHSKDAHRTAARWRARRAPAAAAG